MNRTVRGESQAAATGGNSNVVPVITMSYDDKLKIFVDYYFGIVWYIVINFYKQGGTVVFPVKELNTLISDNISIGTGIATDPSYADRGRNFAKALYSELLNIRQNMRRQPTSMHTGAAMKTFNDRMKELEQCIEKQEENTLKTLLTNVKKEAET